MLQMYHTREIRAYMYYGSHKTSKHWQRVEHLNYLSIHPHNIRLMRDFSIHHYMSLAFHWTSGIVSYYPTQCYNIA